MKILIRGAGDLATGIAARLYGAGHQILMTEIPVPLTVRRTVAFSRAVYDKKAIIEGLEGYLADSEETARVIMERGGIAVMVDPEADCRKWFCPDVLIDAILAKKNLGTKITDAPFVIGTGPGFIAGKDVNCVIETKRGHTLGKIIWEGTAIPNTGIPGNVGGFTIERLIRASAEGILEPRAGIGDYVEKGQIVALTGGKPVYAKMSGMVRGMLQPGVRVSENLKIGDIDARAEQSHCYIISDKAKAIGGGVLEAVTGFERMKGRCAIVILAAGKGRRFGGDKLLAEINGLPMYKHMLKKVQAFSSFQTYIVTGDRTIADSAAAYGVRPVWNDRPELGVSRSVRLGLEAALNGAGTGNDLKGILFSVCDQPAVGISTIQRIFNEAMLHPGSIVCAGCNGERGNPVFWDRMFFDELRKLEGDTGGKQVMEQYSEKIRIVETDEKELRDIDTQYDLP